MLSFFGEQELFAYPCTLADKCENKFIIMRSGRGKLILGCGSEFWHDLATLFTA
jgi:hypothetical protein